MKYLKRFNEKLSFRSLDGDKYTQDDIENFFNISMDEIEDIVSDVLDESPHLSCEVSFWSKDKFVIGFHIIPYGEDASKWSFKRGLVTKYVSDINHRLNSYGLEIYTISNEEYTDTSIAFAVNLFISKMNRFSWKSILESNYTNPNEENLLQKYFDITSDDIKDWCQDFLDESQLDFEVGVVNSNLFIINFFDVDSESRRIRPTVTKEKYPFSEEVLQFLKDRLKAYDCYIDHEPGESEDVYYAINKQYISLRIVKKIV